MGEEIEKEKGRILLSLWIDFGITITHNQNFKLKRQNNNNNLKTDL